MTATEHQEEISTEQQTLPPIDPLNRGKAIDSLDNMRAKEVRIRYDYVPFASSAEHEKVCSH